MIGSIDRKKLFSDLEYVPHPGQLEVHMSNAPRRVLACGVRWGKSVCAAMEAIAAALEPCERSVGWVVAPTYDLAQKVYREVTYIASRHLRHRVKTLRESDRNIVLRNMGGGLSEIRAKSADNPTSLLGEGLSYCIVDEAARLKPLIWQSHLSQRLIDKKGWALLISTPKGKGWFYDIWRRGQGGCDPDYKSWNYPSASNPHLDAELIEAERSRLPEMVFRQEFLGDWVEGAGAVFRYVRDRATGSFQDPMPGQAYYAGVDLAKVEDYTVLVILNQEREVVFVDRFHRLDWNLQITRIKAACDRYNEALLLVDSTGVGEPVYEAMLGAGLCAQAYPFTARSKSDLVNNLSLLLEKGLLVLPRPDLWPEGIDELEAFEYSVSEQGNVKTSAPGGTHDDCVAALGLACWHLPASSGSVGIYSL